jgi:hypothetical protein
MPGGRLNKLIYNKLSYLAHDIFTISHDQYYVTLSALDDELNDNYEL